MIELLRAVKLGAVNLFGVAIPGFLLLFFSLSGVVAPAIALALGLFHAGDLPGEVLEKNKLLVVIVIVIFSYVAGYILRLTSPDKLDEISAKRVLQGMEPSEKRCWPYAGLGDKFPYDNFWCYLEARGLDSLRRQVTWGKIADCDRTDSNHSENPKFGKRSKTAVHQMKLDVMLNCPDLFAEIESNEAHVRLMSGTWLAIRASWWIVLLGAMFAIVGIKWFSGSSGPLPFNPRAWLVVLLITNVMLLGAMGWGHRRIVTLFHYRRVNELVWIVMAADFARTKRAATAATKTSPNDRRRHYDQFDLDDRLARAMVVPSPQGDPLAQVQVTGHCPLTRLAVN